MKFTNLNSDQRDQIEELLKRAKKIAQQQQIQKRYLPLIISWVPGAWKDTVLSEVQNFIKKEFWISIWWTFHRYLSRKRRTWEESSYINFVSRDNFKNLNLWFNYEFLGNLYWLDTKWIREELMSRNVSIVNGSPEKIRDLFNLLFSDSEWRALPPLIIFFTLGIEDNEMLLEKRWLSPEEIEIRKIKIWSYNNHRSLMQKKWRYKKYVRTIFRKPGKDNHQDQKNFNRDVIKTTELILWHIHRYLNKTPKAIAKERARSWLEHIKTQL